MNGKMKNTFLVITLVIALFLTGCQPAKPSALTNDQVIGMIERNLTTINARDYQGFTQDFSEAMKSTFSEAQFTSLAELLMQTSGKYVSCADSQPELSNKQDFAVYRQMCIFDLESVIVTVTFKVDGDKIEGLFFDSTNLRKASQ
jgi:hypothetical protein